MAQIVHFHQPPRDVRSRATASSSTTPTETEALERAAYDRGRRDGENALREQLLAQRNEFLDLQHGVIQSMRDAVPQVVRDSETTVLHLAIETAQRLVAALPVSAEMVEASVREALGQVADTTEVTVLLNPEDLALLEKHQAGGPTAVADRPQLAFRSSPEVTRGGCLVQTRFGVVDGRRETKVELIKKAVTS
jgi:flagellar assembly protein FliH